MLFVIIILVFCITFALSIAVPAWAQDEHVMEHVQLLFMLIGAAGLLRIAYGWPSSPAGRRQAFWGTLMFGALVSGIGREISFGKVYGLVEPGIFYTKLGFAAAFMPALAVHLVRAWPDFGRLSFRVTGPKMRLVMLFIILFLLGDVFEKGLLRTGINKVFEESFEMVAYVALSLAALRMRALSEFQAAGTSPKRT